MDMFVKYLLQAHYCVAYGVKDDTVSIVLPSSPK